MTEYVQVKDKTDLVRLIKFKQPIQRKGYNVMLENVDYEDLRKWFKQKWVNILANAGNFPHPAILKMKSGDFHAFQYARLDKRVYEEADEEDQNEFRRENPCLDTIAPTLAYLLMLQYVSLHYLLFRED